MNKQIKLFILLAISIVSFILAFRLTQWKDKDELTTVDIKATQKSFDKLVTGAAIAFENACTIIENGGSDTLINNLKLTDSFNDLEAQLIISSNDSLLFWTSNQINPDSLVLSTTSPIFNTKTIYGLHFSAQRDVYNINLFIPIIYSYPFTNKQVKNRFNKHLSGHKKLNIEAFKNKNNKNIISWKGQPILELFSPPTTLPSSYPFIILVLITIGILALLSAATTIVNTTNNKVATSLTTLIYLLLNVWFFHWISHLIINSQLTSTDLFSPSIFASGETFPGVGFFIIFTIQLLAVSLLIFRSKTTSSYEGYLPAIIQSVLSAIFIFWISKNTIDLVNHSTVSLLIYKLTSLPLYSLLAFIAALLQFGAFYLLYFKSSNLIKFKGNPFALAATRLLAITTSYLFTNYYIPLPSCIPIFLLIFTFISDFQIANNEKLSYQRPLQWILISAFSLFLSHLLLEASTQKQTEEDALIVSNLSTTLISEHDFETEYILAFIEPSITTDDIFTSMVLNENMAIEKLENYLLEHQFNELKESYDFQFILCWPGASLDITGGDTISDCYNYFNDIILAQGASIMESNFYFLNNSNGRKSYFGQIAIKDSSKNEVTLYIDLQSKLLSQGEGYPEILKSGTSFKSDLPENYSSAKYVDDKLATSTGLYAYSPLTNWIPTNDTSQLISWEFEKSIHTAKRSDNTTIVISRDKETSVAFILLFSYHFLLTYLFIQLLFGSQSVLNAKQRGRFTLEKKLKYSFAAMLIAAFLILGTFAIYYNYTQQKSQQETVLKNKLSTIHKGLEQYIGNYPSLEILTNEFMVEMYLKDLSNMFNCDVNLYDMRGDLTATSRPEIFSNGLVSSKINPEAFFPLRNGNKKLSIHTEKIGLLSFSSLYMVLTNDTNTPIGIVNIPFFVSSQDLTRTLTNYLIIILNLFIVFLVITIIFSTALGRKFIRPIKEIQQKMAVMKIGAQNEKIIYKGTDELRELIDQYNMLVDELEKSVQLLAQSEREMAWRKMARQIAHEIKNPLTPMRLSIQQLQRLSTEDPEHFKLLFGKTSISLIEQIDTLTEIASSFATFAKTPKSNFEKIDLNERLEIILNAFQNMRQMKINFTAQPNPIWISADKNQTTQLINNLIKNAIQAISKDTMGIINIHIGTKNNEAILSISDNGKGISAEIQDKLFEPNFTTKTSGMGLGLAISKSIVTSMGGKIRFTSEEKVGTTFFVTIPII